MHTFSVRTSHMHFLTYSSCEICLLLTAHSNALTLFHLFFCYYQRRLDVAACVLCFINASWCISTTFFCRPLCCTSVNALLVHVSTTIRGSTSVVQNNSTDEVSMYGARLHRWAYVSKSQVISQRSYCRDESEKDTQRRVKSTQKLWC